MRQDHQAHAFYFILYGSGMEHMLHLQHWIFNFEMKSIFNKMVFITVLIAVFDDLVNSCKTACRMFRGESFGVSYFAIHSDQVYQVQKRI